MLWSSNVITSRYHDTAVALFGPLYIGLTLSTLVSTRALPSGEWLIVFIALVTWASDIGASITSGGTGKNELSAKETPASAPETGKEKASEPKADTKPEPKADPAPKAEEPAEDPLLAAGRDYAQALGEQMAVAQALLEGLGYSGVHFELLQARHPQALDAELQRIAGRGGTRCGMLTCNSPRKVMLLAYHAARGVLTPVRRLEAHARALAHRALSEARPKRIPEAIERVADLPRGEAKDVPAMVLFRLRDARIRRAVPADPRVRHLDRRPARHSGRAVRRCRLLRLRLLRLGDQDAVGIGQRFYPAEGRVVVLRMPDDDRGFVNGRVVGRHGRDE